VNLLSRLNKLEGRLKKPFRAIQVAFQYTWESSERAKNLLSAEKLNPKALLIVVKFVEPKAQQSNHSC